MSDSPKGWAIDSISNLFSVIKEKGREGVIPYLEIGNIDINNKTYIFTNKPSVKGCKKALIGDVLISRVRPTRGAITQVKENSLEVSSAFTILRNSYGFQDKYLWFYLAWSSTYLNHLGSNCTGTMYPTVSEDAVVDYEIPLAPLPEQRRIVAKLERLLHKVDASKARLDKIPAILKRFRQSVLAAACSGRLTADWREGNDLPEWDETTIREIAISMSTGPFGSMLHSYDYIENGIPVINPTNIVADKIIPDNTISLVQKKADELARYRLQKNDILLARRGDLSKCGIVTEKEVNWIAGTGLFILRAKINPKFFKYLFGTDAIQRILNTNSIGSTMLNLNQTIMGDIELLLPSLPEQQEIVCRVEALFKKADEIEARYKKAKGFVDRLTQSILAKAFRGELVPQDPNDEPAAALLDRIRAERGKQEPKRKGRK